MTDETEAKPNTKEHDFGVDPYPPEAAVSHACGLLDVIKSEWGEAWTEHDQKTRAGLSRILTSHVLRPTVRQEDEQQASEGKSK